MQDVNSTEYLKVKQANAVIGCNHRYISVIRKSKLAEKWKVVKESHGTVHTNGLPAARCAAVKAGSGIRSRTTFKPGYYEPFLSSHSAMPPAGRFLK
ncbi:hypothetical protein [Desulfoluna limicola]|uniref:hypothetical protein n=1 Tax=Desulfoluna limicola TaxID=2810562 RepID=UPI001F1E6BC1|nr:hypothetical protein [Desulfoluna limicola]